MSDINPSSDPDDYVNKNQEQLVQIIKHSSDTFVRALALAALVEYGADLSVDEVVTEIRQMCNKEETE